jgi:NTP pyrophosphatase (non-canonical NTP hydrolase)
MSISTLMDQLEAASESYARRYNFDRSDDWLMMKLLEEIGELVQANNRLTGRSRIKEPLTAEDLKHSLADELADSFGMIVVLARRHNVDLAAAIERKWRFRPEG